MSATEAFLLEKENLRQKKTMIEKKIFGKRKL